MVGVPALRPETFPRSFPKTHRAQTRNTEAIKHNPNDEGQSVNLVEPPSETPDEPSTPAGKLPKTGDSLPLVPLACLVGAALTAAGAALMARRPDGPAPEKPHEGEEEGE